MDTESVKINLRLLWLRLRTLVTMFLAGVGFAMIGYGSFVVYSASQQPVVAADARLMKAATAQPMLLVVVGAMFVLLVTYQR